MPRRCMTEAPGQVSAATGDASGCCLGTFLPCQEAKVPAEEKTPLFDTEVYPLYCAVSRRTRCYGDFANPHKEPRCFPSQMPNDKPP